MLDAGLVHRMCTSTWATPPPGPAPRAWRCWLERALALEPGDAAVASNLAAVRRELVDRVVMPGDGGVGEPLWHGFIRG